MPEIASRRKKSRGHSGEELKKQKELLKNAIREEKEATQKIINEALGIGRPKDAEWNEIASKTFYAFSGLLGPYAYTQPFV